MGSEQSGYEYYGHYSCTRVLLHEKVLEETEPEETRLFCHGFIICSISIERGPGPLYPHWLHHGIKDIRWNLFWISPKRNDKCDGRPSHVAA